MRCRAWKDAGGHSLIVDATVSAMSSTGAGNNSLTVRPTHAVLHRPVVSSSVAGRARAT